MARRNQRASIQMHLLDRRPKTNRVWKAIPRPVQEDVTRLLAMMLRQSVEAGGITEEVDDE